MVALGHLLMDDSATRRHPLHVTGGDGTLISHAVAVLRSSRQDVGDSFDSTVGMPGKASKIILRNVIAEVIQQKERVELLRVSKAKGTPQMHTGTFERGLRLNETLNRSNRHVDLQVCKVAACSQPRFYSCPLRSIYACV